MPIKRTNNSNAIKAYINEHIERIQSAIEYNLCYVGETCVNKARSSGNYTDRTHNLRSSTGYIVVRNGAVVQMSKFEPISGGAKGGRTGKSFATELAKKYNTGYVLIVVAGMRYAAFVSAKGYDVLDSAELLAERLVPDMLKRIGLK